ncbi:MAG: NUDIX hydrolase, partial [Anaerolineae bacterium]|nr:NUDIX hydrolase [Anaerolineae bacterium]
MKRNISSILFRKGAPHYPVTIPHPDRRQQDRRRNQRQIVALPGQRVHQQRKRRQPAPQRQTGAHPTAERRRRADPGEDALSCARRELAEETGLRAGSFRKVLEMDLSNSLTDERAVIFVATELAPGAAEPDATEVLRHRRAPFPEVLERVADGRIRDSLTVAAVLRAHHMAVTGKLPAALAEAML